MEWFHVSLLLCVCGFLKEIRPSEPYVTDFLQEPYRDVTAEELNRYILPISTYAMVIFSFVVLLITDFLRYKVVIISMGICGTITSILLIWTKSFTGAQWTQITYAAYMAQEVAYFAYIYAQVPRANYLAVSSHTRAALLLGRCVSGVLAQLLVYTNWMNIPQLNYITLITQIAASLFAVILPAVSHSIYFHRSASNNSVSNENNQLSAQSNRSRYCDAFQMMWRQFIEAYSDRQVLLWSIWYACGLCGYIQVLNYVQSVWIAIDNRPEVIWNGAVDAIIALLCTFVALFASRLHSNTLNTKFKMLAVLCLVSLGIGCAIFCISNLGNRIISYVAFMMFYAFHTFTITISSAEIAKRLPEDSYGLIFGINTCVAYCLQAVLTGIVVSDLFSMGLSIFGQFNVYGGFYVLLSLIYLMLLLIDVIKLSCGTKQAGKANP